MAMELRAFSLLFTIWLFLQVLASYTLAIRTQPLLPRDIPKNSWPEVSGMNGMEALKLIKHSGEAENVYIQDPTPLEDIPDVIGGNVDDVWIYTDGSGFVLGIPKRGEWHPNRLSPGWTKLKGVPCEEAIRQIKKEDTRLNVLSGPEGMIITSNFDTNRVVVRMDPTGKVAQVPHLG